MSNILKNTVSGHGTFDPLSRTGFLVTTDTKKPDPAFESFLGYPILLNLITNIPCRHILLVADACFAGTLDHQIAMAKGDDLEVHKWRL